MSSIMGNLIKLSVFGESHGPMIGVTLDGLPPGEPLDYDAVLIQMARRAPGVDETATPRAEKDTPRILSGMLEGRTTGAPLCAVIENTNIRSKDYKDLELLPRPSHADYPAHIRYKGHNDIRGGGHFSGRLTAPLTFAGAVCRQILERKGIIIGGHVRSVGNIFDSPFDLCAPDTALLKRLSQEYFAVISFDTGEKMRAAIEDARRALDSLGGTIEIAATGLSAGIGSPMFGGLENRIAAALFGIPAVKGLEFGSGFALAGMTGQSANDPYYMKNAEVFTYSNHNGGILGGLSTGMPLILRAAIKPTASIAKEQRTVNLRTKQNAKLIVKGRHDPCIVPRALPVAEAMVAVVLCDMLKEAGRL